MLGHHCDQAERRTRRQRAGVPHENHRQRRVEPEEAQTCADQCTAEDRELAGAGQMVDLLILGEHAVDDDIGDQPEAGGGDHDRHDREPVEPVGQVDHIGRADDDEDGEGHREPADVDQQRFHEGQREAVVERCLQLQRDTEDDPQREDQLRLDLDAGVEAAVAAVQQLECVVRETNGAEPDGDHQQRPDQRVRGLPKVASPP